MKCKICYSLQIFGYCTRYWAFRWQRHSETTAISILCTKQAASFFFPCSNAVKNVFSLSFCRLHPRMHHHYGVISRRHTSRDCVWPIILVAGLYTTWCGERVLVVIRCNATFLPLRPYWEKICTCFLNDAKILITYGCVLWCSQIVYIRSYSLNITTTFYFVIECRTLQY